jgi:DNA-binding SARP family transcriptional activator
VDVDGTEPDPELQWNKNRGLLLYLARSPHGARSREHLVGIFWADKPDKDARHSLNVSISTLRRAVGDKRLLSTSAGQVRLQAGAVQLDADELDRLASEGDWAGAVKLAGGPFCEGFAIPDASGFEDWLTGERRRCAERQVEVLLRRGEELERRGFETNARQMADRALDLEPRSEPAIRLLMRSLALSGDRAAALSRFDHFRKLLAESLGTEPEADTLALGERLRRGHEIRPRMPAKPAAGADTRRLPLIGRARELEYLLGRVTAPQLSSHAVVAVVEAYPGFGRTRLLEEVTDRAAMAAVSVVAARAVAADRADPSSGIIALACGGLLDAPGISGARSAALATLAGRVIEWAERFPTAASAETLPLGRAFGEVVRAAVAERPVLIVVDDAQWLDADSYQTFEILLRDMASEPLALLLSVGAENVPPELDAIRARFGREVLGDVVRLPALTSSDIGQLVGDVLPATTPQQRERLVRRLELDSAGIPLLIVELLHAIASGLDPEAVGGGWPAPFHTLDDTLPADLPDTLVAAIRFGFRRLSVGAQQVLATASVLGDHATPETLAAVTELGDGATATALDELEWSRWLLADARGYSFLARIVREVVARDMLTAGQRRRIAQRWARVAQP